MEVNIRAVVALGIGTVLAIGCVGSGDPATVEPAPSETPAPEAGREGKVGKRPLPGRSGGDPDIAARAGLFPRMSLNNTSLVARTGDGRRHATWIEERGVIVARWEGEERVDTVIAPVSGTIATIASDGAQGLAVAWNDTSRRLFLATSADAGQTWSEASEVPSAGGRHTSPSLRMWTSKGDPGVLLAWSEGERNVSSRIYSAVWEAGRWSEVGRVDSGDAEAEFPALTGRDDRSVMVWRDNRSGSHRIYVAWQESAGGKWKRETDTGFTGRDPSVCVDGEGRLYAAWHDLLKLRFATWDGRAWSTPAQVLGQGLFARVDCNDRGDVLVSWERYTSPGRMQDDELKTVGLSLSHDRGATFEGFDPASGATNLLYASSALQADGTVDAIWADKTGARVQTWTRAP